MNIILKAALLIGAAGLALPAAAQPVSSDDSIFTSFQNTPFGPGDRSMSVSIKLAGGETNTNTEVWVIYGTDRNAVANGTIGGSVAQARVTLASVNASGVASGIFIFPHSDHPSPNPQDRNAQKISSGATVWYKLVKRRGTQAVASPLVSFRMPDKLTIANLGDSYASGEGAPYASGAKWDNELCHRSGNSGQARAVRALKAENPEVAIAFRNVACSGAEIAEGILFSQLKPTWLGEPSPSQQVVPPQLQVIRNWLADQGYSELNIAMVSGGGNDIGFGSYVQDYMVMPGILEEGSREHSNLLQMISNNVPAAYQSLLAALDQNFEYDRVLVSEYPDPLRGRDGLLCDQWQFRNPRSEFIAFNTGFLQPLNTTIRNTVSAFPKFRYVGGTMQRSRTNGLCNVDTPYFNSGVLESIAMQGDIFGIVHPNRRGHRETYQPVYEAELRQALRDIRLKWAKIKAVESARAKAEQERLSRMAKLVSQPQLTAIARVSRLKLGLPAPADARELAIIVAKAKASAAATRLPADGVTDNRMAEDEK